MTVNSLITDSRQILLNINHPKVLNEFRKFLNNQDVAIIEITEDDIKEFTDRMLKKFKKYLDVEEK